MKKKEVCFIEKKPAFFDESNYYKRKHSFLIEIRSLFENLASLNKNIYLKDVLEHFEIKYGFPKKIILFELKELEAKSKILIKEAENLIFVFSNDDIDEKTKQEAEAEADNIFKGVSNGTDGI